MLSHMHSLLADTSFARASGTNRRVIPMFKVHPGSNLCLNRSFLVFSLHSILCTYLLLMTCGKTIIFPRGAFSALEREEIIAARITDYAVKS